MESESFLTSIETEYETELSRLGSSKALYAVTEGEMEDAVVRSAMAQRVSVAEETFGLWASTEQNPTAAEAFEAAAVETRDFSARINASENEDAASRSVTEFDTTLRELDETVLRAGGFLAWILITDRTLSQAVGFFVGSADTKAANRFREIRDDIAALKERSLFLLDTECEDDDWETAALAAGNIIEEAYAHYVDVLEGMGIKVKPVC